MAIEMISGVSAYQRAAATTSTSSVGSMAAADGDPSDFSNMVQSLVTDTATKLQSAETAGARQVAGQGDLIDVVTAIGAAETALNTVVAVRDRMVGAYNEIMRMQV